MARREHVRYRETKPARLADQVELQPPRNPKRKRGDDDLVVVAEVDRVLDRHQWLGDDEDVGRLWHTSPPGTRIFESSEYFTAKPYRQEVTPRRAGAAVRAAAGPDEAAAGPSRGRSGGAAAR